MKNIKKIVVLIILAFFCTTMVNAATTKPFIIRNDKKRLPVKKLTADENGVLAYQTSGFSQKLKPGQYIYARVPLPEAVKNAKRKYNAKKYKDAVKEFSEAFKTARYLGWGSFCMLYAAKSLESMDKKTEAIEKLKLLKEIPKDSEEMPWFLKAKQLEADLLIAEKKFDAAGKVLSVISKGGDQKSAMFANNAKGDILIAQGKNSEALFMYMRNILLFSPDKSAPATKAIDEVVKILKAQNDPRAEEFEKMK
jgi:predicted negative regulator of RcsB-dependent stress response